MKRKILIITLTVIALTLIIISVVSLTNKEESKSSKEESKLQENAIKLADPSEIDPTNSWEAVYLTTLIDISKNVYPKDKDIPLNGRTKAFVTLKDLSENHGIDPECSTPYMDQELTGLPVRIGTGCWIGEKVIILPGVSIGEKSIIGAGSIVTKKVPSYSIAVGNPAKIIKKYNFSTHRWEHCKDDLCCVER